MPGRILVVDDIPSARMLVRVKLNAAYFDVTEAPDGETAIEIARREAPDLILLDVMMPGIDGFETCRRLKAAQETGHIPVVMLTALDKHSDRLRGMEAGVDDFLTKPFNDVALISRVDSLTRMKMMADELRLRHSTDEGFGAMPHADDTGQSSSGAQMLLISGDAAATAEIAAEIRQNLGCAIDIAEGEAAVRALVGANRYDAFIIGTHPADGNAMRIASLLRSRPSSRRAALMMMFHCHDKDGPRRALEMGVSDYLCVPPDYAEMATRLKVQLRRKALSDLLRNSVDEIPNEASSDALTGLHNRRYGLAHLQTLITADAAKRKDLSIMLLDIDRFRSINARFGHGAGHTVLAEVAGRLSAAMRSIDLVARIGGEEFLVIMHDIAPAQAEAVAERVRRAVERPNFAVAGAPDGIAVTLSIGMALHLGPPESAAELIARAEAALARSKTEGRNTVTVAA